MTLTNLSEYEFVYISLNSFSDVYTYCWVLSERKENKRSFYYY